MKHRLPIFTAAALCASCLPLRADTPRPDAAGQDLVVDGFIGNTPYAFNATDAWRTVGAGLATGGTINHGAGTITVSTEVVLGGNNPSEGFYNQSGGVLATGSLNLGRNSPSGSFFARGLYNLSGGTLTTTNTVNIGLGGVGVFTQTGGLFDNTGSSAPLLIANVAGSQGVYHLNAGTLKSNNLRGGGGTSLFNFNGGTLQAGAASTAWLQSLGRVNVRNGGARFDTNGFSMGSAQVLEHSNVAGDAAIDGGLTKLGAGTLTLTAVNTFTGNTSVTAGTLALSAGGVGAAGSTATVTVNGPAVAAATLALSGTGSLLAANVTVGQSASGTIDQSGGTLTISGGTLTVGSGAGGNGVFNYTGGTLAPATLRLGHLGGTGAFNVSAGNAALNGAIIVGGDGAGTLTLTGGTFDNSAGSTALTLGQLAAGNGTVHLESGGALLVRGVTGGAGTNTFNFNGGVLRAGVASTTFFRSLGAANVRNGGAIINTNGFNATVEQVLRHSTIAGDAATDGGLIKRGTGTLTLTGANTYNGNTTVANGTLAITAGNVGVAGSTATVTIANTAGTPAALSLSGTGTLRAAAVDVGSVGAGTLDHSAGTLTSSSDFAVGGSAGGSGIYNLNGGTLNAGNFVVGLGGSGGTVNLSSGTATMTSAYLATSAPGTVNQTGGTFEVGNGSGQSLIGQGTGAVGTVNLSGGTFRAGLQVLAFQGTAVFNQTGGTHTVGSVLILGYDALGNGTYHLNGGTLTTQAVVRGNGPGTFNFNGGTLQASLTTPDFLFGLTAANVRNNGAIIDTNGFDVTAAQSLQHSAIAGDNAIDGGLLKLGSGKLTLLGVHTYTGRTAVVAGTLAITSGSVGVTGSDARFDIDGPVAAPPIASLSGTGSINGGKVYVGPFGAGTFNQSGGSMTPLELVVAYNPGSSATFNQTGGTNSPATFYVGYVGTGTFNLGSGSLTPTGAAYVGVAGPGAFHQTGGLFDASASSGTTALGLYPGFTGAVYLSAGSFRSGTEVIGYQGTGTFTQTGGTHSAANYVVLAYDAGSAGTYHLDGGTLTAPYVIGGGGTSTLNLNGGLLQAAAHSTNFVQGLTTAHVRGGGAKVDTNGFNVSITQPLLHSGIAGDAAVDGGLTKSGAGRLTLTAPNTYNGPTQLNAGTTSVAATGTLGSAGSITNAAGSTLDVTAFGGAGFPVASGRTLTNSGGILGTIQVGGQLQGFGPLGGLVVNAGGVVANSGPGTLVLSGAVTNHGTIRFAGGAVLNAGGAASFVNNGVIDLITAGPGTTLPANLTGTGIVLTASSVKVKSVARAAGVATVSIDGYDGHVYSLQRSNDLAAGFTTVAGVAAQPGVTGTTLTFTDNAVPAGEVFYRVLLNP